MASGIGGDGNERWVRRLHNLYLVTLLIALVATIGSSAVPSPWRGAGLWLVAGLAVGLLAAADLLIRRVSPMDRRAATGYFLAVAVVIGALTAVFPAFSAVAFGAVPLAFVFLRRTVGVVVGLVLTGLPYLARSYVTRWLSGDTATGMNLHFGALYAGVVGIVLPVLTGLFAAGAIHALRRQSQSRQALVEQLSATQARLAAASRLAGRAEERQRLAHELHDTVAQGLAGVVLQLEAAEQYLDLNHGDRPPADAARLRGMLTRTAETARGCLAETRRAVDALRPEALRAANLPDAVKRICREWTESTGVATQVVISGHTRRHHPDIEVAALRVTQEALANAGKHAAADNVTVTVGCPTGELHIAIRDNGRGFDPDGAPAPDAGSGRYGLATMRERVEAAGGTLTIASAPGAGTTVTAILPDSGGRR